jgi:amylovoran biosynthesis glycosyltransferase AmsE
MSFSCLISCYKNDNPSQLEKCLKSIQIQTLQCNEIVFVKDGPLSNELELVLGKFEDTLPFKFVEISVNKGLGNALKQGLEQCGNEIVIRMDTDDICEPNRFAEQFNYMNAHPAIDIVGSWAYDIEGNDTIIGERKYPLKHEDIYRLMWTILQLRSGKVKLLR